MTAWPVAQVSDMRCSLEASFDDDDGLALWDSGGDNVMLADPSGCLEPQAAPSGSYRRAAATTATATAA